MKVNEASFFGYPLYLEPTTDSWIEYAFCNAVMIHKRKPGNV